MWYAIHDAAGVLVSVGTSIASPLPAGLVAVELGDAAPDLSAVVWNSATRAFAPRPVRTVRTVAERIMREPEVLALTATQRDKLRAALARVLGSATTVPAFGSTAVTEEVLDG